MTKQELGAYFWMKHEIAAQKERVKRLERCREKATRQKVRDVTKNYSTGKGKPEIIESADNEYSLEVTIGTLKKEIEQNIVKAEAEAAKIERYIQDIEEPRMRELIRCRFIDCMNWEQVGEKNYISPDHARKLIRKFINKFCENA